MTPQKTLIAVVGGGAAGMAAAIMAADSLRRLSPKQRQKLREFHGLGSQPQVVLLERSERIGKKILVTGNGRCNLSHENIHIDRYHGQKTHFAQSALQRWDEKKTLAWFRRIGLPCRFEADGRVFPHSLQAASVLDILRCELRRLGVATHVNAKVQSIKPLQPLYLGNEPLRQGSGLQLITGDGLPHHAACVIVATGGKTTPALGCDGSGYSLLQPLGHELVQPFPSLVQIQCGSKWTFGLAGTKVEGTASFHAGQTLLRQEEGEILFTRYGLSGPPILQLSRLVHAHPKNEARIELDFLPQWSKAEVKAWLDQRQAHDSALPLTDFLTGLVAKKIGQALLKQACELPLSQPCQRLDESMKLAVCSMLKSTRLPVTGTLDWDQAQVTAGGISVDGFHPATLESRVLPGLFAAGEMLDIDADCGGFNLQWAWSSGLTAGMAAIRRAQKLAAGKEGKPNER